MFYLVINDRNYNKTETCLHSIFVVFVPFYALQSRATLILLSVHETHLAQTYLEQH